MRYYFIVPLKDYTDEFVANMSNSTIDTVRKSMLPINNEICFLAKYTEPLPSFLSKYPKYTLEEIQIELEKPEWSYEKQIHMAISNYDLENVLELFEKGYHTEAFRISYITLFELFKIRLLIYNYLNIRVPKKWKIFERKFLKANEETILTFSYYYDLLDENEFDSLSRFREKRNNLSHSFEKIFPENDYKQSLFEIDKVITRLRDII